jgi:tetratricopeptide (TPR) repeat protein
MLSIAVLCLAAYSNGLSGPFVFDDRQNIRDNQSLHWTSLSWSGVQRAVRESPSSSRPVANVSFALNYYFGRDDVWGYHAVNVGIHLLTALLVYLLALATLGQVPPREDRPLPPSAARWIALSAALIFASHPIQTQAVTYIVQRMTSLCALFYLAALLLYIRGRTAEAPRRRWALWAGGFVCWVLALGSKQIAATLPLTILLYEWYFFQDLSTQWVKKNAESGLLVAALLGLVGWAYLGSEPLDRISAGYATRDFTLDERLLTQPRAVMLYLSLLVFPHPSRLNLAHHLVTSRSLVEPITTLLSMAGICGLLGLAIYLARRHRIASFCLLWFFLHLMIESSVIALEMVFEHRLYLPMFGFSLLVAWLLYALAGVRSRWAIAVAAAICLLLAVGTYQRNRVWQNQLTLWEDAVAKSPLYARPHNNLGNALQALGRTEEAIAHYQEALRIKPDYANAHYNWGLALPRLGRFEEAVMHNQEALRIEPDYAAAHNNLAWLRATCPDETIRDGRRALAHAMRAVELVGDDNAVVLDSLSAAYAESGDFDEAVRWQERAVQLAGDEVKDDLAARLELYKQGQPYRDSN